MSGNAPSSAKPSSAVPGCVADGLGFGYGGIHAVRGVSFAVPDGQFFTLLGPSGCGKTTLLKLLGGYLTPAAGRVRIRGRDVTDLVPERRNTGMVFQNYALFPHLSARRNVSFGLEVRGVPRAIGRSEADAMLDRVGIAAADRDRAPAQLSGGQQQRVALARALVTRPDLLLLDEPLANLDRHLREQLRDELRRLQRETGVTTILVTHDQEEALSVSDLIAVMTHGRLVQVGPPAEVYHRPRTPFVARFLGAANLLDGDDVGASSGQVVLVRPERLVLGVASAMCPWRWSANVTQIRFRGPEEIAELTCSEGPTLHVRGRVGGLLQGNTISVGIPEDARWIIPEPDTTP